MGHIAMHGAVAPQLESNLGTMPLHECRGLWLVFNDGLGGYLIRLFFFQRAFRQKRS
jgi:hypothetical protein